MLASGSGTRVGAELNKVYLPLAGRPVLAWSLAAFAGAPGIGTVVLVIRPRDAGLAAPLAGPGVEVVHGGATRQESELCALRQLAGRIGAGEIDTVLIHDGARPLVSRTLVADVLAAARHGGAVPGVEAHDLATAEGRPLTGAVRVQTPQGFPAAPLLAAYLAAERDGFTGTDTASCMQQYADVPVRRVPGDERNIKITYAHDLPIAERLLARGT
ncbi:2-C-methyl-D-erythritol 4-phosphate cytidylyltransferase [Amycolatopsis suaedae]|uniref:2-C-methyl-D-erythritol 4-phosphate cytidylyltransferase n=1 Tax=Amycolatopsis suaedae TaxID=2510978 RepID=A0A4Q7IYU7_9PSEU|nr:2-C-methyl-D-erythritol 4-phosphate cytidylyltransferase [Amycolatopsis suaedae]